MKNTSLFLLACMTGPIAMFAQNGNIGIGTTTPTTKLDVNGSFRTRPLTPNTNGNSGSIPLTTSAFVVADADWISPLTLPANPQDGQRLVIYSRATFTTVINTTNTSLTTSINMLNGDAYEFIGNGGTWAITPSSDPGKRYDYDWMKAGNAFPNTPADTVNEIYHVGGGVSIGTNQPTGTFNRLQVVNNDGSQKDDIKQITYLDDATGPAFIQYKARRDGSGNPVNLQLNDELGLFGWNGHANGAETSLSKISSLYMGDGTTSLSNMRLFTSNTERMHIDENGLVGISTATPATTLHVMNQGSGGAGVFNTNTANMALRLENLNNGQSVIQHLLAKDAGGATKEILFGINPTYNSGNGTLYLGTDGSAAQAIQMDLVTGNVGIGTPLPSNKLHIAATADPVRFSGLQPADNAIAGTVVSDNNGVLKLKTANSMSAVRATGTFTIAVNNTFYFTDVTAAPTETFDNLNEFSGHTFTPAQPGLYQVTLIANFNQRDNTNDSGDGYLGYVKILAGTPTGSPLTAPNYSTTNGKVTLPEVSGALSYSTVTNSEIVKLAAGEVIQLQVTAYGSSNGATGSYVINITRID